MIPEPSLIARPRLTGQGGAFIPGDLSAMMLPTWSRSSRARGGYWAGSSTLTERDMTRGELDDLFSGALGILLEEKTAGLTTWEGILWDMRLTRDGQEWQISLNESVFHNRVKVAFSDNIGSRDTTSADWSENTSSSDIFGTSELFISLGGSTAAAAQSKRDSELTEFAWPDSREVAGDARTARIRPEPEIDTLEITVLSAVHTLDWKYRETSETAAASTLLSTLIGESEFVTAGRIETNSDSTYVDCVPNPQKLFSLILGNNGIVAQGDSSGNIWHGGVYEDQKFVYEPAPTNWTYQLRGETLLDAAGIDAVLPAVRPGFYLLNTNSPAGWRKPGTSNVWNDPRLAYVDEVEYIHNAGADQAGMQFAELRMHYQDTPEGAAIIARRIRSGNQ